MLILPTPRGPHNQHLSNPILNRLQSPHSSLTVVTTYYTTTSTPAPLRRARSKRTCELPKTRWSSPPMEIWNPRGVTNALPASPVVIEYILEGE
ncbi:hypothetical protein EVAR_82162_1 [Eumeta japonica]|uniref:Uncharacterized protein n=1 Tax=Eumeta variegata TaxID=151549 RepID=A0A4C1U2B4_EUMVA|nr:hypothetical protein EVAR_82162_1 [Eumeta japonica]